MPAPGREPSMEDILASIKKVIAEEKELRSAARNEPPRDSAEEPPEAGEADEADVLELDQPVAQPVELGPALLDDEAADKTRSALEELSTAAAAAPPVAQANPLEEMVREMLKPILKQWLDDNLPQIVEEHVKREISRITGRPL